MEEVEGYIVELMKKRKRLRPKDVIDELWYSYGIRLSEEEVLKYMEKYGVPYEVEIRVPVRRRILWIIPITRMERRIEKWYYDEKSLREDLIRFLSTERRVEEIERETGIPRRFILPYIEKLIKEGIIERVRRIFYRRRVVYRVQKMKIWALVRGYEKYDFYQVVFREKTEVPNKVVQLKLAPEKETDELSLGTYGCLRVYVYTHNPEKWSEERLEGIMMNILIDLGFSLQRRKEVMKPYIETHQAFESKEIDPDEVPPDVDFDEPYVWAYISKEEGFTYIYQYQRTVFGWREIGRWLVK
ncbi:MAG: hypothetical protein QXI58_05400 [Candidatus Micrarchaeia archaeon]